MDTGVGVRVSTGRDPSEGVWLRELVHESLKDVLRTCAYEKPLAAASLGFRECSEVQHPQPSSYSSVNGLISTILLESVSLEP